MTYVSNARISEDYPYIVSGDSTVFNRFYQAEEEENIADDEYSEDFFFQVPDNLNQFSYQDEELRALKMTLKQYCFCLATEGTIVERGSISGLRFGDRWEVTVDVDLKYIYRFDEDSTYVSQETINKSFSGSFRKKPIPQAN